ncbi:MAG: bioA [Bacteroidota bacterium]|nr:bioA [Bacteroidota bacterium]
MNLSDRDKQYIWHPFTQHQADKGAIAIVRGEGALLFDENGKEYIDAISSWWTNLFGHANPHIAQKIKEQVDVLEHVIFAGFTHQPAVELSEKLIRILPENQSKVFFSDNGSTCVEVALKMAIQFWHNTGIQKKKVIAFKNAYHGDTFGSMSVGARGVFNEPFESFLFDVEFIELPSKENFEQVLQRFTDLIQNKDVAVFIFEPLIQGSAGMLMYEAEYLDQLIKLAQENSVICVADEVMTGFGRTGKNFACDHLQNKPDIFCLSKGITGGFLPLGVTTCTQKIYEAFLSEDAKKTFFHGHSYTGNPLACTAGNASIELLQSSEKLLKDLVVLQKKMSEGLRKNAKVENLRQLGTIVAFDIQTNKGNGYFNDIKSSIYNNFIERGILLRPLGNTVYIMPPYIITLDQLQKVYMEIEEVLNML